MNIEDEELRCSPTGRLPPVPRYVYKTYPTQQVHIDPAGLAGQDYGPIEARISALYKDRLEQSMREMAVGWLRTAYDADTMQFRHTALRMEDVYQDARRYWPCKPDGTPLPVRKPKRRALRCSRCTCAACTRPWSPREAQTTTLDAARAGRRRTAEPARHTTHRA